MWFLNIRLPSKWLTSSMYFVEMSWLAAIVSNYANGSQIGAEYCAVYWLLVLFSIFVYNDDVVVIFNISQKLE